MKLNFILLAIVIAFIICYCFSKKKKIQEGQISVAPQTSGGLLNGYEDILIGISEDYKLFRFNNPKKEWQQLRGKSCCVTDLAYWNDTLLGVGRYDHRLYAWDKMGIRGGLWKLATNLPMEWMQSIGVWKNKLFSANQQSLFRWTGKADGKSVDPFKRGSGHKPTWVWCGAKPNVKSIKEYRNQLLVVDKQGRIEMFVDGKLDQNGKLKGSWRRIGQPTEGLRSICEWNDKLMGVGTDNYLYEWSDERQNWFSKTTKFKLLSIISLSYDQYQSQFNKPKTPFSCADGFKLEPQDGKRCYRAEGEELDWWSAYNKCKDADPGRKTTLAVISSKNEDDFVKGLMQHPKWIGCSEKEGEWTWPDGETLEKKGYSNWNQKEPSGKDDEHYCEQYESGVWNDAAANEKKPYVCSHTTSLRREAGGSGGGRKCTEHKDKKKNYLYWNSNKWPVTAKDKDDCKNLCENDPKCPQADYYETGKRCYLYADNDAPGARRPRITGSTPGETYFKCNTEAFTGSMKEGFTTGYSLAARGRTCQGDGKTQITNPADCWKAHQELKKNWVLRGVLGRQQISSWHDNNRLAKGCFVYRRDPRSTTERHYQYFNNATGTRAGVDGQIVYYHPAVCRGGGKTTPKTTNTTGYSIAATGRTCQGEGKTQITSAADCWKAHQELKKQGVMKRVDNINTNRTGNWGANRFPKGCFTYRIPNRDMNAYTQHQYFNTSTHSSAGVDGTIHQYHPAVCRGGTSSPPPPPPPPPAARPPPPGPKAPPKGTIGIHYKSVKWSSQAGRPAATTAFKRFMASKNSEFGYCTKNLNSLWGFKNQTTCPSGKRDNIAWEITVNFKEPYGAIWYIEPGVDFGLGGFLEIDGKVVATHNSDQWGGGRPESSKLKYQGRIAAGDHVLKFYGAENCCDGQSHIRFKRDNGKWRHMTKPELEAVAKLQAPYKASAPSVGVCDDKTCVFDNITIGSAKERSAVFTIKKAMFVTKIVFEHKAGRISCARAGGNSNFGCGDDMVALIITDSNKREILPNVNVKGYKKTHHNSKTQAHWYKMEGVGRDSKTMTWELNAPQTFMPGDYRLWYNEDITNWTESDNIGWATYKMTMTDGAGNTEKFEDKMLKDLHSGLCLGVEPKGEETQEGDGGRVVLSYCQRGDDKMWSYNPDSMQLTNKVPGVCAVIQGASKASNAQVVMGKCNQGNGVRMFYDKTKGTFYSESGQCLENHSASKQVPKKNLLPGSIVQNPCSGGKNQRFSVVAPPPAPPAFKSSSERNTVMLVGETPLTLKKNNLLRMINAERDYRLEFTITPTAKIPGWSEIFHVTTSDRNCCGIGDRMPGMWFYSNTTRLHIRSGGADGGNLGIDPPMELPLNKETTVVVELNGKFMTVKYSGAVTYQSTIPRSDDRPYGKAKFYACSNWYNAAKASVKNVKWTNKTTPPLGKNAVMCNFNVAGEVNSIKYKGKDLKVYGDKADPKAIKTVNFDSGGEDPGKIIVDAKNSNDGDGCKTSGFIMSCQADPSNPWNDFTSNKTHWSAVGTSGQSFRDKSGFPCETTASNLSLSPKEGFRGFREGLAPGKKIWASTGQKTVKIEGGPRLSPEVSCPTDFHGVPLKITAWGASQDNGTATVQTEGGAFNIFNKDTGRLRGSDKIRLRPKQPKNGKWFADPIKERKTDSQGTLYLKTHMNPQWVRIPNDYRQCFQDATELFVTSGDLGGGDSGEQCSGGLQYILHPKGSLCPEKTQIKTREECENAIVSLGIGKGEKDNYPWDKVLESKSPAGCSWTDRVGKDGPATARWNAWPNSAGDPLETYHPVCYSKPPSQAAYELLKTEGCHKCPQGTYSKEGSNECVVCTKNSTNKECREGGKDQTSGLVCPAGTSSTGAVVTAEGKPMNLGEEQSSGNNSSESLKDQCKAFNSGSICDPPCNNTHGRCVGGMCMCGGGYRGPTCDEAPKARIPTVEEWNAAFEAKKDIKEAQEEANKPETISYGYHEHTNMNKPFTDSLRELNKDVQELLVEARKQKEKKKKQRSFLPSEFLGWSQAIPGLLGKQYKGDAQPKPIDVGIAIDDRRKIHFRQQAKGKDTKLARVKSSPQVISSDAGKITSGSAQDDLKGANSFKDPKTAPYRGFNDDSYLKGPNKPIQKAG